MNKRRQILNTQIPCDYQLDCDGVCFPDCDLEKVKLRDNRELSHRFLRGDSSHHVPCTLRISLNLLGVVGGSLQRPALARHASESIDFGHCIIAKASHLSLDVLFQKHRSVCNVLFLLNVFVVDMTLQSPCA